MKKLLKKAITLSLCACMVVGMATGASAAGVQPRYTPNVFANWTLLDPANPNISGLVMNVLTWDTVNNKNNNQISLYNCTMDYYDPAQSFAVKIHPLATSQARIYSHLGFNSQTNRGFTINQNPNTGACTTWVDDLGAGSSDRYNSADSEIDVKTDNFDLKRYRIQLVSSGKYLNTTINSSGKPLAWTNNTSTIWVNAN